MLMVVNMDTTLNTTIFCTPEANFTADPVCETETTQFENNSSPSSNMNWEWDFGDNTNITSSDFQPGIIIRIVTLTI